MNPQQSDSFYKVLKKLQNPNVAKTLEVAETKTSIISKVLNGDKKESMKVPSIGCNQLLWVYPSKDMTLL